MLYLHAPGQPVHHIPSGHRTDAACYVLERKSVMACGCDGCRLNAWMMDILWWHRMRHRLRTDRHRHAYLSRAVRLLDRGDAFIRSGKLLALEEATIDRGIAILRGGKDWVLVTAAEARRAADEPGVN